MTRLHAMPLLAFVLFWAAACTSTGAGSGDGKTTERLEGTIQAQERRIEEPSRRNGELDREVKELNAKLAKLKSAEELVASAKGEISEEARKIRERFQGDSDISVDATGVGYRFVLHEQVLFETGSSGLSEKGQKVLGSVADALRGGSDAIHIEGHTDDVPVAKAETLQKYPRGNIELSTERALAVWEWLVKSGQLREARMSVTGYGPHKPRVPNTSDQNRFRNRRVEIRIAEGE
mgnify:FL=1